VAVGPLVVAEHEDEGVGGALEERQPLAEQLVGARHPATLEVAHVDDEGDTGAIDLAHHRLEGDFLQRAVGRVAHERELEGRPVGPRRLARPVGMV
jgi:hypothetical protein